MQWSAETVCASYQRIYDSYSPPVMDFKHYRKLLYFIRTTTATLNESIETIWRRRSGMAQQPQFSGSIYAARSERSRSPNSVFSRNGL